MKKIEIRENFTKRKEPFRKVFHFIFVLTVIIISISFFLIQIMNVLLYSKGLLMEIIIFSIILFLIFYFGYGFLMSIGWYTIPIMFFPNIKYDKKYVYLPWYKLSFKHKVYKIPIKNISVLKCTSDTKSRVKKSKTKYLYIFYPIFFPGLSNPYKLLNNCLILLDNERNKFFIYPIMCLSSNYKEFLKDIKGK